MVILSTLLSLAFSSPVPQDYTRGKQETEAHTIGRIVRGDLTEAHFVESSPQGLQVCQTTVTSREITKYAALSILRARQTCSLIEPVKESPVICFICLPLLLIVVRSAIWKVCGSKVINCQIPFWNIKIPLKVLHSIWRYPVDPPIPFFCRTAP